MSQDKFPIIFDGHNDVLERIGGPDGAGAEAFFERGDRGHLDLPRAREGGFGGGLFAIWVPTPAEQKPDAPGKVHAALDTAYAMRHSMSSAATLFQMEDNSDGKLQIVRKAAEIQQCLDAGVMPAVVHMEGADAIDANLDALHVLYRAGLRSLGLVWGRENVFARGVPSSFRGSADTGPGLTEAGRDLVRACNELRIMLDVSHLNERGFWDLAELTNAPLVATHSNAHAICPSTRNLTDPQLDAIADSDGMVGLNFGIHLIREDGVSDKNTPLQAMVQQIDYLVERIGIGRVGFGSDFDGIPVSREIGDVSGLPGLMSALSDGGYDESALRKLAHENWLRVLRKTWGE